MTLCVWSRPPAWKMWNIFGSWFYPKIGLFPFEGFCFFLELTNDGWNWRNFFFNVLIAFSKTKVRDALRSNWRHPNVLPYQVRETRKKLRYVCLRWIEITYPFGCIAVQDNASRWHFLLRHGSLNSCKDSSFFLSALLRNVVLKNSHKASPLIPAHINVSPSGVRNISNKISTMFQVQTEEFPSYGFFLHHLLWEIFC